MGKKYDDSCLLLATFSTRDILSRWVLRPATATTAKRATAAHLHSLTSQRLLTTTSRRPGHASTAHLCSSEPPLGISNASAMASTWHEYARGRRTVVYVYVPPRAPLCGRCPQRGLVLRLCVFTCAVGGWGKAEFTFAESSGELVVVYLGRSRVVLVQPSTHLAVAWALSEDLLYFVWVFIVRTTPDLRTKSYAFHAFSLLRPPHTRRPARSTFLEPHNCTPLTPLHYNSQALPLLSSLMYKPLCSP